MFYFVVHDINCVTIYWTFVVRKKNLSDRSSMDHDKLNNLKIVAFFVASVKGTGVNLRTIQ